MKRIIILILGIMLYGNMSFSQIKGFSSFDMENMMKGDALEKLNSEQLTSSIAMPFGNVVDAKHYYIGPGDIFLIQNLSTISQKDIAIVTPENKLIVPRIGEVDLMEKTLAEAQELILAKIQGNTKDAIAFVSLYKPRNVIVEVMGNVTIPGTYTYPASFKISTVIKFANQLKPATITSMQQSSQLHQKIEKKKQFDEMFSNSGMPYISSFQTRNILVQHSDGTTDVADLEKAQVLNDSKFDPYIREADRIFVPYDNVEVANISISGSILRPFVTAYKKGDMASLLLKFGGGLQDNADLNNVKLYLPDDDKTIDLKIDDKLNLLQEDIELQPGSYIMIGQKKSENKSKAGVVSVVGNVANPGVYPVFNDKTTIKEIIDMSGGFTDDAYLPLATIIRRDESINDPKSLDFQLMESFKHTNLTPYDTTRYKIDIIMREPRVSCDFVAIFKNNDTKANVSLKDGDIIKIPSNPKTVFVFGQVKNPGYIKFEEGKNMNWYIEQAGGFAETSNEDGARIIRGNNKTWVEGKDEVAVFAGDEIYIPAPANIPAEVKSQTWAMIAAVVGAVASLASVSFYIYSQSTSK